MTSHGAKVAAFNLAEMKSKEADRRAAVAKEAVMEVDCDLARQWTQLKANADLVREASEAASAEALQMAIKMVQAEEELDESRRLGGEKEYVKKEEEKEARAEVIAPRIKIMGMERSGLKVSKGGGGRPAKAPVEKCKACVCVKDPDGPKGDGGRVQKYNAFKRCTQNAKDGGLCQKHATEKACSKWNELRNGEWETPHTFSEVRMKDTGKNGFKGWVDFIWKNHPKMRPADYKDAEPFQTRPEGQSSKGL